MILLFTNDEDCDGVSIDEDCDDSDASIIISILHDEDDCDDTD